MTAPPERVKAVDPHGHGLEPFFDVVPVGIVELTAQFVTCEGSQVATSIDEKLRLGDIVFLGETVEKRRRGVYPVATVDINFESVSIAAYNHYFSPSTSICFSSTATCDGSAVGGSLCVSASFSFQFQTA